MKLIWTYIVILCSLGAVAQEKDRDLPKGNDAFNDKKYTEAEARYRVSQSKFKKSASAYNLGNAIYRQGQIAESKPKYLAAIKEAKTYQEKHRAYHNLGNVFMKEKEYQAAVEAYKNALRANPDDEQTRYNYALAKKMLKDNPPPEGKDDKKKDQKDKNKDNKDQKDKQQDQKDQQKDQDQKQPNQPKPNQGNSPNQQPKQPKPQGGGISKDRLQNLLDAVNNEEKKIQDKVNAKKVRVRPVETEKDW